MTLEIVRRAMKRSRLAALAEGQFGDMVKVVVDVERRVLAVGGELHSDEEAALIEDGSAQGHLWGINLYPAEVADGWIEFDSMINVRPSQGNRCAASRTALSRIVSAPSSPRWCRNESAGMTAHVGLAAGRWGTLSLAEQLANVGSEVDRAIAAWEAHRSDRFDRALARALELLDLTANDHRWRGHRRREILRWREEFCRLFFEPETPVAAAGVRAYFLRFAVLAGRSRSARGSGVATP